MDYNPTSKKIRKQASRRIEYGAEITKGTLPGHAQKRTSASTVCVFLEWGAVITPDTVSQLLLQAGDVERNPGPRPGDEDVCGDCGVHFMHASRPVQCRECSQRFCRTAKPGMKNTCVGLTRWRLAKILEGDKPLICRLCRGEEPRGREEENEGVEPGRCIAPACRSKAKIRKGAPFLICSSCEGHYHVQRKCSELTTEQRGVLDKSRWKCPICIDKEAQQVTEEVQDEAETESRYQQTKANGRTIKILQLNSDSILSKFEELKKFVEEKKIDVFVIQETKLIRRDKLPKMPGFAIERQDRHQPKGRESNRGGGLITGVRETLAKKRLLKFSIKGNRDHLTEWLTIEIPTSNNEKVRITNVYIPPANSEASVQREAADDTHSEVASGTGETSRGRRSRRGSAIGRGRKQQSSSRGGRRGSAIGRGRNRQSSSRGGGASRSASARGRRQPVSVERNDQNLLYSNSFDVRRWPCREYDMILGDTNAHSVLWDNNWSKGEADERGRIIENWCAANSMAPLNDGHSTRRCRTSGKGSAPDQAYVHSSKLDRFSWEVTEGFGSDHLPIIISYQDMFPTVNNKPSYKWNLKKADWDKFTEEVEKTIPTNYARKSLNKIEKRLRKTIIKAANKHIGKKKINMKVKSYLTAEVKESIRKRNVLSKEVGTSRRQWREACKKSKDLIKAEKEKCWKEYVAELDRKSDAREIFRTIRAIDGQGQSQQHKNEVLEVKGVSYIADKDKAEQFAKTYREFSRLPRRAKDDKEGKRRDRAIARRPKKARKHARLNGTLEYSEMDISAEEVMKVIKRASNNKAAGMDDIPYELIKHLGPQAMEMLVQI